MSVPIPGPYAQNYEDYIGKIFRPANSKLLISTALSEYSQATEGEKIPASIQLKHERDNDAIWEPSPLESMFSLYETSGLDDPMPKYPVYEPKRSSEYYSIANKKPLVTESSAMAYKVARTRDGLNVYNKPSSYDETTYTLKPDARRFQPNYKAKYFLVDYQTFKPNDRPIAQHMSMSPSNAMNRYNSRDTRILGSNFAIISLHGPDAWFNRVDKLLKEAKEC